jgi:hypothetical protein
MLIATTWCVKSLSRQILHYVLWHLILPRRWNFLVVRANLNRAIHTSILPASPPLHCPGTSFPPLSLTATTVRRARHNGEAARGAVERGGNVAARWLVPPSMAGRTLPPSWRPVALATAGEVAPGHVYCL